MEFHQCARNLVVIAMKRSGNNAVKDWITHGRHFAVQGNVRPKHVERRPEPSPHHRVIVDWPLDLNALKRYGTTIFRLKALLCFPLYIGLEDQAFVEPAHKSTRHVLIVRSFSNVFSSRLERSKTGHHAYPGQWCTQLEMQISWWCNHVDALVEQTDEQGLPTNPSLIVPIYYDRWLTDETYRCQLGEALGVKNPARLPSKRGKGGGGSSFEGRKALSSHEAHSNLLNRAGLLTEEMSELLAQIQELPNVKERIHWLRQVHGRY